MPMRGEVHNEKPLGSRPHVRSWQAIDVSEWILRLAVLALIIALPWYFGSVRWQTQYLLGWAGVALSGAVVLHCVVNFFGKSRDLGVPWLTWLFIAMGLFAWMQSKSAFTWQGTETAPPSVHLQRWALGVAEAPNALKGLMFNTTQSNTSNSTSLFAEVPCDLKNVPETNRNLAWSIEPLHTRGAAMSLFLCGLFVWLGRICFSDSNKQLWLFGTLTLTGILIACVGIEGVVSHNSINFLGLRTGSSFATFVSKNSAGGFYNICIAGCLGLLGWTLLNTRRLNKDVRYRFPDTSLVSKIRGVAEDTLADINTAQISAMLCLIVIVIALLISQCRGAAVSALGAIFVAAFLANSKTHSRGNWIIAFAVLTVFITSMLVFNLDEKAYGRLESLSEIDLENELSAGRAYIWSIAWKSMSFYGWLGSGLGTFHFAYMPFQQPSSQGWFYHAESVFAQCGVELGYLGLSVLIIAIIVLVSGLQIAPAKENWGLAFPSKLAGTYLVFSQTLHSFVDQAIVLPALFVPACILIGSVQGALRNAQIAPAKKRSRSDNKEPSKVPPSKNSAWLRNGIIGIAVATGSGVAVVSLLGSVKSLAVSQAMMDWLKTEEKKPLEEQQMPHEGQNYEEPSPYRVEAMAAIFARDSAPLKENSIAMGAFADSLLFEYRLNQVIVEKPQSAWSQSWSKTSPVFLQMALNQTQDQLKKNQIIDVVGGEKGMELLGKSANWYAMAQTKSPLDWRLLWGRCLTNTQCDRSEMARLLPASLTISQHNSQQLLAATLVYRDKFDPSQLDAVLVQAMKSNIWSALNVAKILAIERKDDGEVVKLFPQRWDLLQAIASETFTKAKFPTSHRLLWEKAAELIKSDPKLTPSRKKIWLADCSRELGDLKGEIDHLREAIKLERSDFKLHMRLANRLLDNLSVKIVVEITGDDPLDKNNWAKEIDEEIVVAKEVLASLRRLDPTKNDVKLIADRISELESNFETQRN